jgi:hypothetical protein
MAGANVRRGDVADPDLPSDVASRVPEAAAGRGRPRPRDGLGNQCSPEGKAQFPRSERRPRWPERTSGEGMWPTPTFQVTSHRELQKRPQMPLRGRRSGGV